MTDLYLATHNSDRTEGKGHAVGFAIFDNEAAAVRAVRGMGVMGVGDGDVYRLLDPTQVFSTYDEWVEAGKPSPGINPSYANTERVYGYRKDWRGRWGYGWVDNRDAPVNDPEYKEYKRLQEKFGDA